MTGLRVGQGYDVHRLEAGRPLIIGGVTIAHDMGLAGHSDADVLLHAVTDALLGAAALGDIGRHFPDTAETYRGADSRVLLRAAYDKVRDCGWHLVNLDTTVIAESPKLAGYIDAMRYNLAGDLAVDVSAVNVKAKTNEKLGYLGQREAIEAQAICLLMPGDGR